MNAALWLLLFGRGTYRAPPISDPIDWIEFTATGATPIASALAAAPACMATIAVPSISCFASEATASGSGAIPTMGGSGRPLR